MQGTQERGGAPRPLTYLPKQGLAIFPSFLGSLLCIREPGRLGNSVSPWVMDEFLLHCMILYSLKIHLQQAK